MKGHHAINKSNTDPDSLHLYKSVIFSSTRTPSSPNWNRTRPIQTFGSCFSFDLSRATFLSFSSKIKMNAMSCDVYWTVALFFFLFFIQLVKWLLCKIVIAHSQRLFWDAIQGTFFFKKKKKSSGTSWSNAWIESCPYSIKLLSPFTPPCFFFLKKRKASFFLYWKIKFPWLACDFMFFYFTSYCV